MTLLTPGADYLMPWHEKSENSRKLIILGPGGTIRAYRLAKVEYDVVGPAGRIALFAGGETGWSWERWQAEPVQREG